ncbi:MAG: hypothetical protein J1G06_03455 [Oscillospiraceae bacterium]|nr:hypothetical protein [Oscillospiraceae bacterium]
MRECIYCGKQLEKGEVCTCALSVAKRREKAQQDEKESSETKKESKQEARAEKAKEKAQAKERAKQAREREKNTKRQQYTNYGNTAFGRSSFRGGFKGMSGNPFVNAWKLLVSFLKSPIETVMNPGRMGIAEILIMVIIEGIICGLCAFAIITGAPRGILSQVGNIMGFGGTDGFTMLGLWLRAALSGAVSGLVFFFVYSGIFFAVSKWIFRQFTPYWDFVKRFVFVGLPITVVGIVGTILGLFALRTFIVLIICGLAGSVILTYELLRSMWSAKTAVRTMYAMLICMFVFFTVMIHLTALL